MKDFEDMTDQEKEEILKQIQNLPEDSRNSADMFIQSFNEFSQNWSTILKEFDTMYSADNKENSIESIKEHDTKNNKWLKIRKLFT
jgi:pyruvate/oxaloacetate carboxyltransferase